MGTTITIAGTGAARTVTVESDESLSEALKNADINLSDAGLEVEVNGESVNPEEYSPEEGDQVIATPRKAKLG